MNHQDMPELHDNVTPYAGKGTLHCKVYANKPTYLIFVMNTLAFCLYIITIKLLEQSIKCYVKLMT